ncbi:hypothetical protein CIPAW_16G092800 [Carya illinoinensis]|uniref:Uncharacterized protein n=1 Tax=Carya illinoinensis TaxID=32201 RepID=A0A8T1N7E5_CARIL|nr:hypothetical protein CIPAW_16G092800 [Carya illinoinensis]
MNVQEETPVDSSLPPSTTVSIGSSATKDVLMYNRSILNTFLATSCFLELVMVGILDILTN